VNAPADPILLFRKWAVFARRPGVLEPDAATLATVGSDGWPTARMVLVRRADHDGFVFYTNIESKKGQDLLRGGAQGVPAALCYYWPCFFWPPLTKQVRVEGIATLIADADADAYWATRSRGSQVAAWASKQSGVLAGGRTELTARFHELNRELPARHVPRPEYWTGFKIDPLRIEFWAGRKNRLHERLLYVREDGRWVSRVLSP